MCLAIPAQVLELLPGEDALARVEVAGVRRVVSVGLLDGEVGPGDWVLIHVGFALNRIDEDEAHATLALLERLGAPHRDEVAGLPEGA